MATLTEYEYIDNSLHGVPGCYSYVTVGGQWAFARPDSYSGTTEGGQLAANPTWKAMGARNRTFDIVATSTPVMGQIVLTSPKRKRHH